MKIGLISNRRSQRNKRQLAALGVSAPGGVEILHRQLDGIEGLAQALDDFAAAETGVLAVNGGDGTVSAVITELLGGQRFASLPTLALLPGGMTNMNAADVGVRGRLDTAVGWLVAQAAAGTLVDHCVERNVIRMDYDADSPAVYGMFFGTAAICRAIMLCRGMVHPLKIESSAAAGATLAYLLARRLIRRVDGDPVLRGDEMTVTFGNEAPRRVTQMLALVTTLDRLVIRSRPFWGKEQAPLHYTGIAYPPVKLLSSSYRILYGGSKRRLPEPHYVSRNVERVSFDMRCPFTLDGELFEPSPGQAVVLSDGGRIRFVQY